MNAQTVVREHRAQLMQLGRLANTDLTSLIAALDGLSVADVRNALIQVLPGLVAPYEAASGELAAVVYEDLRAASGVRGTFYADVAPSVLTPVRVESTARWAVTPLVNDALTSTVYTRLSGVAARAIFDSSRNTMGLNGLNDSGNQVGFQRMARAKCCAFCGMLASRPAYMAYTSEGAAGAGSHDDCRCVVMPVYGGSEMAELASVEREKWEVKYQQAQTFEDGTRAVGTKQILAAWREYHGTN